MDGVVKHNVLIVETQETYKCREDEHLLRAMVQTGRKGIPSGCHGGGCGVCKVKVEKGEYNTLAMSRAHVLEQEEREGIVLACRVFPRSDMELRVIGQLAKAFSRPKKKYGLV